MIGWTKSYRRKWKHPVFRNLRDAGIWSYLIDNAAWCDNTDIRFEGHRILLQRGQIAVSERFLATGFCCDRQVIRRLLDALEIDLMITRQKTHGFTIITICNYCEYQDYDSDGKPTDEPQTTQREPSDNPNIEDSKKIKKEDIKIPSESLLVFSHEIDISPANWGHINGRSTQATADAVFETHFWPNYPPRKGGKHPAMLAFRRALKHATAEEILVGAAQYAGKREGLPTADQRFTKHATTWLNQRAWNDELEGMFDAN